MSVFVPSKEDSKFCGGCGFSIGDHTASMIMGGAKSVRYRCPDDLNVEVGRWEGNWPEESVDDSYAKEYW